MSSSWPVLARWTADERIAPISALKKNRRRRAISPAPELKSDRVRPSGQRQLRYWLGQFAS